MNSTRLLVLLALPLLCSAGCNPDEHGLDELAETITVLEATSRRVCGIDTLGTLRCATDIGLVDMLDMADNDYISLSSNNTHFSAVRDNGDGSGDIHRFQYPSGVTVYEGDFIDVAYDWCALDSAGEIECFNVPSDSGLGIDDPPSGPFVDLEVINTGSDKGACALADDGSLTCFGNSYFEASLLDEWVECSIPTETIVDFDFSSSPVVLTSDGAVTGYDAGGNCISFSVPGAVEVEFHTATVCVRDSAGEISCTVINEALAEGQGLIDTEPSGSFDLLTSHGNGIICASAGHEVTCWGNNWNDGVSTTFTLTD